MHPLGMAHCDLDDKEHLEMYFTGEEKVLVS